MTNREYLKQWREDRNLSSCNYRVFFANVIEELLEPLYHKDDIPRMVKEIMDIYYPEECNLKENEVVDAMTDIRVFAENETENMGYNSELTMLEVIREISSRVQDPKQKIDWAMNGVQGKWLKDKEQPKDTMYKADFSRAKLNV